MEWLEVILVSIIPFNLFFYYSDCNHKFHKLKCNTDTAEIKTKKLLYLKCGGNLKKKSAA